MEPLTAGAGAGAADDSAGTGEFRTDAGRVVVGGGGIHPDLRVDQDTLTDAERRFQRALGSNLQTFGDVIASYALELTARGVVADPESLTITPNMRRQLRRELSERGVVVPTAVWNGARNLIDRQLRRRTLRYAFGRETEVRLQLVEDPVVQRAIELLTAVGSPQELFRLADSVLAGR